MLDNRLHFLSMCHEKNLITEDKFPIANDWYIREEAHNMDFDTAMRKFYDWKVSQHG